MLRIVHIDQSPSSRDVNTESIRQNELKNNATYLIADPDDRSITYCMRH